MVANLALLCRNVDEIGQGRREAVSYLDTRWNDLSEHSFRPLARTVTWCEENSTVCRREKEQLDDVSETGPPLAPEHAAA